MSALRIAILNNQIMPYRVPLFAALAKDPELQIHVVYSRRRARDRRWTLPSKLPFEHTVLPSVVFHPRKPYYGERRDIYVNPTLFFHLVRLRPQVIIGYEHSLPAMTALIYSRLARIPYLAWTEGTQHSERALTRGQRMTRRIIIPRSQGYMGTSMAACANLRRMGAPPDRVFLVPQPLEKSPFDVVAKGRDDEADVRDPKILYVGFLNERKGVNHLLPIYDRVRKKIPGARLELVGNGPLKASLEQQARALGLDDGIAFRGFVEPAKMPSVYRGAHVFILPTLEDTFAVVVAEALASGLPVVCSRHAGAASHLTHGENAFVIDPEDHEQVAELVTTLLTSRSLRQKLVASGRELARAFDSQQVAQEFRRAVISVYQSSIEG